MAFCPDWRSLDFYLVLMGLAFCRAWIVLYVSASSVAALVPGSNWMFLLAGSAGAVGVAVLARRMTERLRSELHVLVMAGSLSVFCAVATPVALACGQPVVLMALVFIGGIASSFLQVLWGGAYACRPVSFAFACYPAAAVMIAVLVVLVVGESGFLAFFVFPLMSFVLLLVERSRIEDAGANVLSTESQDGSQRCRPPLSRGSVVRLMASIGVFSFLCRVFDSLPGGGLD